MSQHTAAHSTDGALGAVDFDLTTELEATFDTLARAGRDDPTARNALFARLSGKIARFLAPWRHRHLALGETADLQQEAFLVFADLVADWSGEGSFVRYFLGFFPWRLRHAIARYERRWPRQRLIVVSDDELCRLLPDQGETDDTLSLLLAGLSAEERHFLALRLGGHSVTTAAQQLNWSRRTAARRWRTICTRVAG